MSEHPYAQAAPYRRWSRAVGATPPDAVDPVVAAKFRVTRSDRIVTAGSCFAQHIARWLRDAGFNFLVTESAHPLLGDALAAEFNYGTYSARYGNLYTARQLLQLLRRAYGRLQPRDDAWMQDGRLYDPFRPAIQPHGFASVAEYKLDRRRHFACVRTAFETMDVLVFTLGLTECWASAEDGCVYPACPGTLAGAFDPARHVLLNFSVGRHGGRPVRLRAGAARGQPGLPDHPDRLAGAGWPQPRWTGTCWYPPPTRNPCCGWRPRPSLPTRRSCISRPTRW